MKLWKLLIWVGAGVLMVLMMGCASTPAALSPAASGKATAITVYVANEDDNSVSVIDGASNKVVATIPVGKWPHLVVFSADGQRAFVANGESATISVIDTASRKVVSEIPVGKDPQGIAVVSKSLLYTANYDSNDVSVVDLETGKVKTTISVAGIKDPMANPQDIVAAPDGKHVYVTNLRSGEIVSINTATNTIENRIALGDGTAGISIAPSGQFLYVGGHGAMGSMAMPGAGGTATPMPGAPMPTPTSSMSGMTKPGAGEKNKDVHVVDLATNKVIGTITCGIMPIAMALSRDGKRLYVTAHGSNELDVIDATTNKMIGTVAVGKNPKSLAVTPDGALVYVTNFDTNDVSVVDAMALKVISTVPVGKSPHGLAAKQD